MPNCEDEMGADREFLFNYRFNGADWGISIHASSPAEAMEKIKQVGMARYKGEVFLTVPAGGGWFARAFVWLKELQRAFCA